MKNIVVNMKKAFKKVAQNYMECMRLYGEALLKGGSYGCA